MAVKAGFFTRRRTENRRSSQTDLSQPVADMVLVLLVQRVYLAEATHEQIATGG
jgi:hypothetical protein